MLLVAGPRAMSWCGRHAGSLGATLFHVAPSKAGLAQKGSCVRGAEDHDDVRASGLVRTACSGAASAEAGGGP